MRVTPVDHTATLYRSTLTLTTQRFMSPDNTTPALPNTP